MAKNLKDDNAESVRFQSSDSDFSMDTYDEDIDSSCGDDSNIHPAKKRRISSSQSSLPEDPDEGGVVADSVDGVWEEAPDNRDSREYQVPKQAPPTTAAPISYFYLFFTDALLKTVTRETNACANNFLISRANRSSPGSRPRKWKDVTLSELKGFIACVINMGVNRRPTIASYWFSHESQHLPWFHDMFARDRFQAILKFFHLGDTKDLPPPGEPGHDPSAQVQSLIDHADMLFRHYYTPSVQLSVCDSSSLSSPSSSQPVNSSRKSRNQDGGRAKRSNSRTLNDCMGVIDDASDVMPYTYLDERRPVECWKKMCFDIFSRMIHNSYVIYRENQPPSREKNPMSRLNFTISVVEDLGNEWLSEKNEGKVWKWEGRDKNPLRTLPGRKEKDCCVCSKRCETGKTGRRRRSRTICFRCEKGLHGACYPEHKCAN